MWLLQWTTKTYKWEGKIKADNFVVHARMHIELTSWGQVRLRGEDVPIVNKFMYSKRASNSTDETFLNTFISQIKSTSTKRHGHYTINYFLKIAALVAIFLVFFHVKHQVPDIIYK